MTIKEIAEKYNVLAQEGKWGQIQDDLFSTDAKSIEPEQANASEHGMKNANSLAEIKKKGENFGSMVEEMHGGYCTEPVIAGNHFTVAMGMDVTMKGAGRVKMDEIAVYQVKDGKIVKEQFFY